ncbi:hypothetical protein HaLaN_26179, partial [Haematococcus lacustris]
MHAVGRAQQSIKVGDSNSSRCGACSHRHDRPREMNWWPEAFPCRAAYAAVGLATRDYIPGPASNPQQPKGLPGSSAARQSAIENSEQEDAIQKIPVPSPAQPSLIWCHGA